MTQPATQSGGVCKHCGDPLVAMGEDIAFTTVGMGEGACGLWHDDNCETRVAWCARLHKTTISIRRRCTACDWVGQAYCASCCTTKLDAWPELPIGRPAPSLIAHPDDVPWLKP